MKNWEALDRELAEIREKLAGRGRLEAMLAELDGEQQALRERKRALRAELDKEQADVDALEGMSLAAIWQTVLGRREEALDQERREAAAARANYQSAVRALEDVEGRSGAPAGTGRPGGPLPGAAGGEAPPHGPKRPGPGRAHPRAGGEAGRLPQYVPGDGRGRPGGPAGRL